LPDDTVRMPRGIDTRMRHRALRIAHRTNNDKS
jgi:hypothetical protein